VDIVVVNRAEMSLMLQLSLYVLTVIQLTSSQSTYDVIQQENDVNSCGQTETDQILSVLSQLMTANSQLQTAMSQLQSDVAELKARRPIDVKGKMRSQEGESR